MKKILCVIDVQNDFIDGVLGTEEAQETIPNIVNKIKNESFNTKRESEEYYVFYLWK